MFVRRLRVSKSGRVRCFLPLHQLHQLHQRADAELCGRLVSLCVPADGVLSPGEEDFERSGKVHRQRPCSSPHRDHAPLWTMAPPPPLLLSLWLLMLIGAGSVLLLCHLQDVLVLQKAPGVSVAVDPVKAVTLTFDLGQQRSSPAASDGSLAGPRQHVTKRRRKLLLKSGAPAGAEEEQQLRLARTQEARRRRLSEVCALYRPGGAAAAEQRVSRRQVSRVYVEDRSRLLYCEVPKAGCSNWKRVLMVLGGSAASTLHIPHEAAHYTNRLRRLESYDRAAIAARLGSYTKLLFVREPFERLVSAFRDKFESPNSYYHPVFGRPIISRYRANATRAALRSGAGVTFGEFVRYLLDVRRPVGMDIHWEPVSQLCHPCLLRYSFIGKFESLKDDANFVLRSVAAPANLSFPDFKDRNPLAERTSSEMTQKYFSLLDATERQKVYDFYYMDYLMFDYPKPFKDLH